MKHIFYFILGLMIISSCKEEIKSKLDFEKFGISEENRYTNSEEEFEIIKSPDSVLIEPNDVEFRVEIDTNIDEYDSLIYSGVFKMTAELINHSEKSICFLTQGSNVSSNVFEINNKITHFINCYGKDYIVCYYPKTRSYIKPKETMKFDFCIVVYPSQPIFTLGYKLKLVSNYHDLETTDPYQYIPLKSQNIILSTQIIRKIQKRESKAFDKHYLTDK